ncbi:M48 family metallopeptidase [Patescibacteria group bacterium]|nr:M48 family metallopeptidase [Patescibacteria group bacterium]
MESLSIDHHKILFKKSRRAKRFRLQLDSAGQFILTAPLLTPKWVAHLFLKKHVGWIEKQVKKVDTQKVLRPSFHYRTGDTFYYFGEPVTLTIKPSDRKRPTIKIRGNEMLITLYRHITEAEGLNAVKKTIKKFYREKAEEVIHDRLQFFNEHYGFHYNRVTLRDQKSRWGSCSRLKNLNFNWRLIMAPIEIIDYVVAHELCHLKEMNHSSRYWALVTQAIPDHKERRKWLRENHYLLTI